MSEQSNWYRLSGLLFVLFAAVPSPAADPIYSDDFSHSTDIDNPWTCVNSQGEVVFPTGKQLVVDDSGNITRAAMSPSIAVGDLNGDGLPDLVVADSVGFFWYMENQGTKTAPKFGAPQLMPIWVGDPCPNYWDRSDIVANNIVPRIQLVDLEGTGKFDLMIGSFVGKLFILRNQGTKTVPVFRMPSNLDEITVATRKHGMLWCNYLSPFFCDWQGNGRWDLIVGDGSYAANSVYLLKNEGTRENPEFSEESSAKIIPGMGREALVPQMVSWNGRGQPDILAADREGFLNLFQFKGVDATTGFPKFDEGQHISVGGRERLPERCTVTMAHLTDANLPDLIMGTPDGRVSIAKNVGNQKDYQFGEMQPVTAMAKSDRIHRLDGWSIDGGFGSSYAFLVSTNARDEPSFRAPDTGINSALKYYIGSPASPSSTFPSHFYPELDGKVIFCGRTFDLKAGLRYKVSFWIKEDGDIQNMSYTFFGQQKEPNGAVDGDINKKTLLAVSGDWDYYSGTVSFDSLNSDSSATVNFTFHLDFEGNGALYLADFKLEQDD